MFNVDKKIATIPSADAISSLTTRKSDLEKRTKKNRKNQKLQELVGFSKSASIESVYLVGVRERSHWACTTVAYRHEYMHAYKEHQFGRSGKQKSDFEKQERSQFWFSRYSNAEKKT
ncbi:hypothetical protein Tsp_10080 [Trichinella spiralis]|uniref:hypothetical protein n=1 Tax=Trichinella spiralis TaxID=6334 RepID=UPI0001EFD10B|nr:hypothetical protein Tsp_10080 [Trichinella spiralis]